MKKILVVDDEALIRSIVTKVLARMGHTTIEAADGASAITAAEQHEGTVDLLLSDLELPDIRGPQIFERVKRSNPQMQVIFMSGFGEDDPGGGGVALKGSFLQKPFTLAELEAAVARALQ